MWSQRYLRKASIRCRKAARSLAHSGLAHATPSTGSGATSRASSPRLLAGPSSAGRHGSATGRGEPREARCPGPRRDLDLFIAEHNPSSPPGGQLRFFMRERDCKSKPKLKSRRPSPVAGRTPPEPSGGGQHQHTDHITDRCRSSYCCWRCCRSCCSYCCHWYCCRSWCSYCSLL